MSRLDIIRAWKDEEYLSSLNDAERVLLPRNPAGLVEVSDDDLAGANGGQITTSIITISALGSCYSCFSCITVGCDITHLTVST